MRTRPAALGIFAVGWAAGWMLAGCGLSGTTASPSPPATAAEACRAGTGLAPVSGAWRVAVETDRADSTVLALVSGDEIALCKASRTKDTVGFGATTTGVGFHPTSSPQVLTFASSMMGAADGSSSILAGRVPAAASAVRLVFGDGSEQAAILGGGLWLAWLTTGAAPTQIQALDASGSLIAQLADAGGLKPSN